MRYSALIPYPHAQVKCLPDLLEQEEAPVWDRGAKDSEGSYIPQVEDAVHTSPFRTAMPYLLHTKGGWLSVLRGLEGPSLPDLNPPPP